MSDLDGAEGPRDPGKADAGDEEWSIKKYTIFVIP